MAGKKIRKRYVHVYSINSISGLIIHLLLRLRLLRNENETMKHKRNRTEYVNRTIASKTKIQSKSAATLVPMKRNKQNETKTLRMRVYAEKNKTKGLRSQSHHVL